MNGGLLYFSAAAFSVYKVAALLSMFQPSHKSVKQRKLKEKE